ncbi:MAG: diguanylate cyclase domain-containing protein [bacterium]
MKNGSILIVDKDRFYRELYSDLLSSVDYDVFMYDDHKFPELDLSLLDLIIYEPNKNEKVMNSIIDGFKRLTYRPEILVITSMNAHAVKSIMPPENINYTYIKKPFDDSKFLHLVTNIIAQRRLFVEKEKLAKEGMEYLILLEVYKRASDILSQPDLDSVIKKLFDAMVVELKLSKAMFWYRKDEDNFDLLHSFGYESETYDEPTSISWKVFQQNNNIKEGYYLAPDEKKRVMYTLVQGQDGHVYAIVKLKKKDETFSVQDIRIAKTLSIFGGIAISNAIKLSQRISDTLMADNLPAYSYRYFLEYTENEIKRANRIHGTFSVAVISIENYRDLVETFGHSYVNEVLTKITTVINEVVRDADTLSASEQPNMLNLFLPDTDYFGSIITMRRIKNKLKQTLYLTNGSTTKNIELIIGSATYPNDGTTAQTLLTKAYDMARRASSGRMKEIAYVESLEFLEFSDRILKLFKDTEPPTKNIINTTLTLTKKDIMDIVELISSDILSRPFMRGLVFLAMPYITKDNRFIKEQYKLYNSNTKLYLMGKKSAEEYIDISYAPIMIINEDIGNRFFMFNLNEEYSYGFIAREYSNDKFSMFHTSDPIIVEELVAVLQEKYFLQKQI